MRIGVVSDTHRNKELLGTVVDWLQNRQKIASLYHLGDDYGDVLDLADRSFQIVQIPGIYHPGYRDGSLPPTVMESVLGLSILLSHSFEKDVTEEDKVRSDIILHGHTHRPELVLEDGLLVMNPGHLKAPLDKNVPPSVGVLDIHERTVTATIYNMNYEPIESMELIRSETGLYRG